MNPLPVRRVAGIVDHGLEAKAWPMTLAPVRQLVEDGLDLDRITILVGENGTGKSTVVEAVAMAYGLSSEGGSRGARHQIRVTESELWSSLLVERGAGARKWGYFLRAETMHGLYSYLEDHPVPPGGIPDPDFHRLSHGESFMAMLATRRFQKGGFFVLDEPESGLSFVSQLTLIGQLTELVAEGRTQLLIATHSPVLARLPGATLMQLDDRGMTTVDWEELAVVDHYRAFVDSPGAYLHHLLPPGTLF